MDPPTTLQGPSIDPLGTLEEPFTDPPDGHYREPLWTSQGPSLTFWDPSYALLGPLMDPLLSLQEPFRDPPMYQIHQIQRSFNNVFYLH